MKALSDIEKKAWDFLVYREIVLGYSPRDTEDVDFVKYIVNRFITSVDFNETYLNEEHKTFLSTLTKDELEHLKISPFELGMMGVFNDI